MTGGRLNSMPRLLARRVAKMLAMVLAIVVVNFLLIHAAPGDPANAIAGQSGQADPEFMRQLREQFGLDKPLPVQLWISASLTVCNGQSWSRSAKDCPRHFC